MQENYEDTEIKTDTSSMTDNIGAQESVSPDSEIFQLDTTQTKAYEKRSHRYQDTKDSAISLLVVGGLGLLFLALTFFQVLPIALEPFSLPFLAATVLCTLFVLFGILSLIKSRKLKSESEEEDAFTASISKWLEENIDASIVAADESLSEADLYFLRCQRTKELLLKEFPDMDKDYIDAIFDENYDNLFEKN